MTKDLLIRFLNNNCTEAELYEVLQWCETSALTEDGKKLGLDDWENYRGEGSFGNDEKFTALFDKIQKEIDDQEHHKGQNKTRVLPIMKKWLTQAAAILLIPVLGFLFYTLSNQKIESAKYANFAVDSLEVFAPIGSRTIVELSDGSKVHLNYGSKLKYPYYFSGETREVVLIGEGYFDVAHNPEQPFVVKAGSLNIKALGTEFNVLAYAGQDKIETTLVNGKVALESVQANGKSKNIGIMVPGQHVDYNIESGGMTSSQGNIEKYIAWKDGRLVFVDTPIVQVAEKLSRMFNVDIQVADDVKDHIYTVTFVDEPLFQILDLMTLATPVSYKGLPRKKLSDGSFSKQKFIIEKK